MGISQEGYSLIIQNSLNLSSFESGNYPNQSRSTVNTIEYKILTEYKCNDESVLDTMIFPHLTINFEYISNVETFIDFIWLKYYWELRNSQISILHRSFNGT